MDHPNKDGCSDRGQRQGRKAQMDREVGGVVGNRHDDDLQRSGIRGGPDPASGLRGSHGSTCTRMAGSQTDPRSLFQGEKTAERPRLEEVKNEALRPMIPVQYCTEIKEIANYRLSPSVTGFRAVGIFRPSVCRSTQSPERGHSVALRGMCGSCGVEGYVQ